MVLIPKALMRAKAAGPDELIPGEPEDARVLGKMIDAPIGDRKGWEPEWPETALERIPLGVAKTVRRGSDVTVDFDFDANAVLDALEGMELPEDTLFEHAPMQLGVHIPGGVGDIIKDPDGGVWIHAERRDVSAEAAHKLQPITVQALAISA